MQYDSLVHPLICYHKTNTHPTTENIKKPIFDLIKNNSLLVSIRSTIQKLLTRRQSSEIMELSKNNPEVFDILLDIVLTPKEPTAWRAAALLNKIIKKTYASRITPIVPRVLDILPDESDGFQRELLKLLSKADMTDEHWGILYDSCIEIWCSPQKMSSTRYIAIQIIARIADKYPELQDEFKDLTDLEMLETLTPAIRKGVLRLIHSTG